MLSCNYTNVIIGREREDERGMFFMSHLVNFLSLSDSTDKLDKEASVSTEGLNPNSPALAKCSSSPPSPLSYEAALKCISFLSEEDRVANHQLFLSTNGSSESVDAWLSALDKGEVRKAQNTMLSLTEISHGIK